MTSGCSVVSHYAGEFDESGVAAWAGALRQRLPAPVSLGLVFMTPHYFPQARIALEVLRVHGRIPLLVGCSTNGLVIMDREIEDRPGLALALFSLPGSELRACHFNQEHVAAAQGPSSWHKAMDIPPSQPNGWLVFADPFRLDVELWLREWGAAYPAQPVFGGLASGDLANQITQVYLDGEVFEEGGVAVAVGGGVQLAGAVSQGCTPIGETWTITQADRNFIYQIANQPAYHVLAKTFNSLSVEEQQKTRGNLFVGLVMNEYRDEFHRGDFLIRNLLGADPQSGVLVVGALPRIGQTLQFQRRDALAANEDLEAMLRRTRDRLRDTPIYGGCLSCCTGRGHSLFGAPDHDARLIQRHLGPLGLVGFFCTGEIGPVGPRNFLHGFTASLALFVKKEPAPALESHN